MYSKVTGREASWCTYSWTVLRKCANFFSESHVSGEHQLLQLGT